ncbi:MAG TPA: DUF2249 domain-containing protein [Thioploca sp.]|nr:DUF2249 domain-containing protein [Thioploca sp.]
MERILAALPKIKTGEYLRVLHRMEPHPLYPILTQQGYSWITKTNKQPIEIYIWRSDDLVAKANIV